MKRLRNLNIITILRILLFLFLVAVLITGITFFGISYRSIMQSGSEELSAFSNAQQQRIISRMQILEANLREVSRGYNIQAFFTQDSREWQLDHLNMANSTVELLLTSNPEIKGISVVGKNGLRLFRSLSNNYYSAFFSLDKAEDVLLPIRNRQCLPYLYTDVINNEETLFCVMIIPIYYNTTETGSFSMDFRGTIIALVDMKDIYARDQQSNPNTKLQTTLQYGDEQENKILYSEQSFDEDDLQIQQYSIPQINLTVFNYVPRKILLEPLKRQVLQRLPLIILIAVIYSLFCVLLYRSISIPVSSIVNDIEKIGYGNLRKRLKIVNHNEVGFIAQSINSMLDQIEVMTRRMISNQEKLYEAEINQNKANLRFYQTQISPHFLYNSLACIHSIAAANRIPEIQAISDSMSQIMRYSLRNTTYVTVADELRCLDDYLAIIETRYNRKIHLKIICDEVLFKMRCVKMILQPIVENCVNHAFNPLSDSSRIYIRINLADDQVTIRVTDNGEGIPRERLEVLNYRLGTEELFDDELQQEDKGISTNIGLFNIRNRLWLYFGKQSTIRIISKETQYTQVIVTFPVRLS